MGSAEKLNRVGDPGQAETQFRGGSRQANGQRERGTSFTIQFPLRDLLFCGTTAQVACEERWVMIWAAAGTLLEALPFEEPTVQRCSVSVYPVNILLRPLILAKDAPKILD